MNRKEKPIEQDQSAENEQEFGEQSQDPQSQDVESQQESELEEQEIEEDEISKLEASLKDSQAKAEEYLDGWQRARAEFSNYKKRINRERADYHQRARGEVILHFLELADDLERALQDKPEDGEGAGWAEGIEIIYQKLLSKLEADGVKPMNAEGEIFDPNIHEALMQEENDQYQSGEIIEVMQKGYWIGDRVLRPALVRVAA